MTTTTEPLATTRLRLTPLREEDAAEMTDVLGDASLYDFTGGDPLELDELRTTYRRQIAGPPRPNEHWHNWIVRLEPDGTAVGYVQATVIGAEADLAWVVGSEWQGAGLATEAAIAMRRSLATNGVTRFTAHIHPDHVASQRVATALGLQSTGETDEDGEIIWAEGT